MFEGMYHYQTVNGGDVMQFAPEGVEIMYRVEFCTRSYSRPSYESVQILSRIYLRERISPIKLHTHVCLRATQHTKPVMDEAWHQ